MRKIYPLECLPRCGWDIPLEGCLVGMPFGNTMPCTALQMASLSLAPGGLTLEILTIWGSDGFLPTPEVGKIFRVRQPGALRRPRLVVHVTRATSSFLVKSHQLKLIHHCWLELFILSGINLPDGHFCTNSFFLLFCQNRKEIFCPDRECVFVVICPIPDQSGNQKESSGRDKLNSLIYVDLPVLFSSLHFTRKGKQETKHTETENVKRTCNLQVRNGNQKVPGLTLILFLFHILFWWTNEIFVCIMCIGKKAFSKQKPAWMLCWIEGWSLNSRVSPRENSAKGFRGQQGTMKKWD